MKRLFILALFLSFLIMEFLGCSEDPGSTNFSTISAIDQKTIEQNIDVFIKTQYQSMVSGKTEELQQALADIVASPEQARGIVKVAKAIVQGSALDNKPYKSFQTELKFNHTKDQFVGNQARISVTENTKLGLGSIISDFTLEHLVVLEQKGKDWKIIEDRILNLPGSPNLQNGSSFDELVQFSQPEQNLAPARTSYRRYDAAAYARRWANGSNKAEYSRDWISSNADCANFVSQCVKAGGWPTVGSISITNPYYWWYTNIPLLQTLSWRAANELFTFVMVSSRGTITTEANLREGDILSIDYQPDGRIDHQMIVTGKNSSGLLLCGHTRARYNFPLNGPSIPNTNIKYAVRVEQSYPSAIFHYVRLYDTF